MFTLATSSVFDEFDRTMEGILNGKNINWDFSDSSLHLARTNFSVDLKESENAYELKADVPGITKEDIDISYEDDILSLKIEKKEKDRENDSYITRERYFVKSERKFRIPDLDIEKSKAEVVNGVLSLSLPKDEIRKAKKIKISFK